VLALPIPDLLALVTGESIVAFAARGAVQAGDEVDLAASGTRPATALQPAYRHWAGRDAPPGDWTAVVEEIHPSAALDPIAGASRHVLVDVPDGDLVVVRTHGQAGPVLSDVAYGARRRSLGAALAP
jgi:hypothetical protein